MSSSESQIFTISLYMTAPESQYSTAPESQATKKFPKLGWILGVMLLSTINRLQLLDVLYVMLMILVRFKAAPSATFFTDTAATVHIPVARCAKPTMLEVQDTAVLRLPPSFNPAYVPARQCMTEPNSDKHDGRSRPIANSRAPTRWSPCLLPLQAVVDSPIGIVCRRRLCSIMTYLGSNQNMPSSDSIVEHVYIHTGSYCRSKRNRQ